MKKTFEQRKKQLSDKIYFTSRKIQVWWDMNKEWAIIVIPAAVTVTSVIAKGAAKTAAGLIRSRNLQKEEALKELYIYDRSLGTYWKLRKKLTTSDQLEIENLRKEGLRMGEILTQLRLI